MSGMGENPGRSVTHRSDRDRRRRTQPDENLAVAYLRVSTEDQHLGPEAQKAQLEMWAARKGVKFASWHVDRGLGGATPVDARPGLLEAINALEAAKAGMLVVAKWDRLGRDVYVSATAERLVERLGARIVSADGVGAGEGPEAALLKVMIQAIAAYERALIRSRTKAALKAKRRRGECAGEVPLGFVAVETQDADGQTRRGALLPCQEEADAIALAQSLRDQGLSLRRIASELTERGITPRGQRWHPQTIARMLQAG